jgi:hypothetical protein
LSPKLRIIRRVVGISEEEAVDAVVATPMIPTVV